MLDTTGNFDVLRLYTLLIARLSHQPQDILSALCEAVGAESDSKAEDVAAKVLDRVKIMRVFDFEGVVEAVGEVREGLEGGGSGKVIKGKEEALGEERVGVGERKEASKRTFVPDSEDEDEDEEEEMLFEIKAKHGLASQGRDTDAVSVPEPGHADTPEQSKKSKSSTLKFILIDNLAHVFGPLSKTDMNKGLSSLHSPTTIQTPKTDPKTFINSNIPHIHPPLHPRPSNPFAHSLHPPRNPHHASSRHPGCIPYTRSPFAPSTRSRSRSSRGNTATFYFLE